MASYPVPDPSVQQPNHAAPYCNDPGCEYCQDLRAAQDTIRMHESGSMLEHGTQKPEVPKPEVLKPGALKAGVLDNENH